MVRAWVALFFLSTSLFFVQSTEAEARKCAVVQSQLKQIFTPKYSNDEKVLSELWRRTAKAYKMIFENTDCVPSKDLEAMKGFVRESKKSCAEARRLKAQNEIAWSITKEMCTTLKPIYKYVK
jgi:hypothetical protein